MAQFPAQNSLRGAPWNVKSVFRVPRAWIFNPACLLAAVLVLSGLALPADAGEAIDRTPDWVRAGLSDLELTPRDLARPNDPFLPLTVAPIEALFRNPASLPA